MQFFSRRATGIAMFFLTALVAGCAYVEPQTGTRITFVTVSGKPLARTELARASKYLTAYSNYLFELDKSRVDKVTGNSLELVLPNVKANEKKATGLLNSGDIRFYHLTSVATKSHSDRPWKVIIPKEAGEPYVFRGPDGQEVRSGEDSAGAVMTHVIGEDAVPILTGAEVLPESVTQKFDSTTGVLIRFNESGAKKLYEFSKNNPGEYLAIVISGRLVSAALIDKPIKDGSVYVTAFRSDRQARAIAAQINAGDLPSKLEVESVTVY